MTEQKPVAWLFESIIGSGDYRLYASEEKPENLSGRRSIKPVYEHPASSQPATDPAAEAARRKALRYTLDKLTHHSECSDWAPIVMNFGVLRDLVGQPRKDPKQRIPGYDEEPKKPTASGEQRLPGAIGYDANGPVPVWRSHVFESQLPEKGPEQPLKVSAPMHETRVNTADLAKQAHDEIARTTAMPAWATQVVESQVLEKGPERPIPARLSVEHLASVIANNGATRVDPAGKWVVNLAKAVHAAVYGGPATRGELKGDE